MEQAHGGNIYALARRVGCAPSDIVDMSSNMNPLGPPPGLLDFLKDRICDIAVLPEADSYETRRMFAEIRGVDPARVVAGNGTTQLIFALPAALCARRALVLAPTYCDYEAACVAAGAKPFFLEASRQEEFVHPQGRVMERIREISPDLVFICNPNNPTGVLMEKEALVEICKANPGVVFVVDESYLPFTGSEHQTTLVAENGVSNLVVLCSMSKIFCVPGLRLGFAACPDRVAEALWRYIPSWSVNAMAHAAARWIFENRDEADRFVAETVLTVKKERRFVADSIKDLEGFRVFPSTTSFLLLELGRGLTSSFVCETLAPKSFLVRDCSNFRGLSDRYIRISLKTGRHNRALVDMLCNL